MPSLRHTLRQMLQRGETIVAPGAYDPISARVVQSLGFPAVYTGGYVTGAHTAITEPLLTLTDQVEVARRVAHAVTLPVLPEALGRKAERRRRGARGHGSHPTRASRPDDACARTSSSSAASPRSLARLSRGGSRCASGTLEVHGEEDS